MKKTLTLLSAVVLLQAGTAIAKPHRLQIPSGSVPAGVNVEALNRRLEKLERELFSGKNTANKGTATDVLAGQSDWDYTQAPGSQNLDSLRFIYSNGRGSAFDYLSLTYDLANSSATPSPLNFGTSYVNFDTIRSYNPGTSTSTAVWYRSYNAANKALIDDDGTNQSQFTYDASNRMTKALFLQNNGSGLDSSDRDFYKYNAGGYLILDSMESYDGTAAEWSPSGNLGVTYDASNRPKTIKVYLDAGGGLLITFVQFDLTYTGSSAYPSLLVIQQINFSTFVLENAEKDTFGYTANTITLHNIHVWDATASAWVLDQEEIRHLNAANLPDSVFTRTWSGGTASTGYTLLKYNSNGSPTASIDHATGTANPTTEQRWFYGATASVPTAKATRLEFYPNPATDKLHLKGLTTGNYMIYNAAGQLMQNGKVMNGGTIPVDVLSPGLYTVSVQDSKGQMSTATFVRQ